jgi:hypothetical protein
MGCQVRVCVSGLSIQGYALWDCSQKHGCALQTLFLLSRSSPCFRSDKMGMGVENVLPLDEERGCTRIFLLFSRVCHGRILPFLFICFYPCF